jgi:hypothetical protein
MGLWVGKWGWAPALAVALTAVWPGAVSAQRSFTTPPAPPATVQSPPPTQVQGQYQPPAPPAQNPVCARLETQLASIERGGGDPSRAAQIQRNEAAVNKQQADLDRLVTQKNRLGCQSAGIFSIFTSQPPQCSSLNSQIDQTRSNLDRAMSDLQQSQSGGGNDLESQRQSVIGALAQNNCGPQYRAAAAAPQRGIFETIFGGASTNYGGVDVSQGGNFRTLCVRSCDGYYYPISFATNPGHFADDEQTCHNTCPAAEVALYSHRTNEDVRSAATSQGRRYIDLPNAFRYRQQFDATCSCRRPGQSWSDAMGQTQDRVERGDIIVTDEKSKALSQPPPDPRAPRQNNRTAAPAADVAPPSNDPAPAGEQRPIRSVGPTPGPMR